MKVSELKPIAKQEEATFQEPVSVCLSITLSALTALEHIWRFAKEVAWTTKLTGQAD